MKLHTLQHVPFEGLGQIQSWADNQNAEITCTRLYAGEPLPDHPDAIDLLIILGGPMGIYDHEEHPWLIDEKAFIKQSILSGKPILGICLGAQLLADALGARVYPGPQKEIGWFPIQLTDTGKDWLPGLETVFHWHGDTFTLPQGAQRLASSRITPNQAFLYNHNILALQFHIETTPQSCTQLVEKCRHELIPADFIQSEAEILKNQNHFNPIHTALDRLLTRLCRL
jgi:GMP synthase-like glutamine amidotransferase